MFSSLGAENEASAIQWYGGGYFGITDCSMASWLALIVRKSYCTKCCTPNVQCLTVVCYWVKLLMA